MDQVNADQAPVIITRKGARPVVLISLDQYEALEETAHLLKSPKNMRRRLKSAELESSALGHRVANRCPKKRTPGAGKNDVVSVAPDFDELPEERK